jgi:hypothetical protein
VRVTWWVEVCVRWVGSHLVILGGMVSFCYGNGSFELDGCG